MTKVTPMPQVPRAKWPSGFTDVEVPAERVHKDPDFLVMIYPVPGFPDAKRMTVVIATLDYPASRRERRVIWREGISWDDLMHCKQACGFDDWWGVEILPPAKHVVNVANMRHVWLSKEAPPWAWKKGDRL